MAKDRYVKLGDKAESFYDPTSKLQLYKGKVVKLERVHRQSKRVLKAIAGGHLQYTLPEQPEDEDFDEGMDTSWKDEITYEPAKLKKLKKSQLVELAKDNETDLTDEELELANKDTIIEEIMELVEPEE